MYLSSLQIENIRSLGSFSAEFSSGREPGWHVLIGDNGSGKSTFVKTVALALAGPDVAPALRQDWREWLRAGASFGFVRLDLDWQIGLDEVTGGGRIARDYLVPARINFSRSGEGVRVSAPEFRSVHSRRYVWGNGRGWFCASFGPFRRFTGGNKDYEKFFHSNPKLAPHLSAFGEDVALTECLEWLRDLHVRHLESRSRRGAKRPTKKEPNGETLKYVTRFINGGGLLPHQTTIDEITADEIYCRDGNGCRLSVLELSDGYRSILSTTLELIRLMVYTYGAPAVFRCIRKGDMRIDLPGVVLIDEIDAHLHPSWQHRVGHWFLKYFPRLQFIVTTHSPLICHAAEKGSIWRLAAPGSNASPGKVTGTERDRLIYGSVLEAYDTELFGENVGCSDSSHKKRQELAQLNVKALTGRLTVAEKKKLKGLRGMLPTDLGTTQV